MSICPNCNSPIDNDAKFCAKCGTSIAQSSVATQPQVRTNKLHCPNCRSYSITVTTESTINGGLTTSRGNMSATKVSSTHRNYWVCSDCGTKFRNIQNLEEEIAASRAKPKISLIFGLVALFFAILMFSKLSESTFGFLFFTFPIAAAITALVCICLSFSYKKQLKAMEDELAYLKQNCFN